MPDGYPDAEAVAATIDAAPDPDGAPPADPQAAPPQRIADIDPETISDDIPYRDAKALREQWTKAKEQWGPYEQALGALDDTQRQALLDAAGDLVPFTSLHPDDRRALAYLAEVTSRGTPEEIAEALDLLASPFRKGEAAPVGDLPTDPATDQPMTRAEFDRLLAERDEAAAQQRIVVEMHAEMRGLGYDPDSTDMRERARVNSLLNLAAETGGDIAKAHEILDAERQRIIDEYVSQKRTDASRTAAATTPGGTPTSERKITTIQEAGEAAESMIDAYFNR